MSEKVIFLDIDGVLNTVESDIHTRMCQSKASYRFYAIDDVRLGLLAWLCEVTGADVVISSSWRIGKTVEWFHGFFEAKKWVLPPIVGVTPKSGGLRGDEINEYLNSKPYEKYVIFDDDSDFHPDQPFIHVNRTSGLTIYHVFEAIDILGLRENLNTDELRAIEFLRKDLDYNVGNVFKD